MDPETFKKKQAKYAARGTLIKGASDIYTVLVNDIPRSSTKEEYRLAAGKVLLATGSTTFAYVTTIGLGAATGGAALIAAALIGAAALSLDYASNVLDSKMQVAHSVAESNRQTIQMMMETTSLLNESTSFTSGIAGDFSDSFNSSWEQPSQSQPFTFFPDGELDLTTSIDQIEVPQSPKESITQRNEPDDSFFGGIADWIGGIFNSE